MEEMSNVQEEVDKYGNNQETLSMNSLKIFIVKEICDKLKDIKGAAECDEDLDQMEGKDKLAMAIKYGMVEKKSDGKITWESRFFVMT